MRVDAYDVRCKSSVRWSHNIQIAGNDTKKERVYQRILIIEYATARGKNVSRIYNYTIAMF